MIPALYFLKDDEQLLIEGLTTRAVVNGPGRYLSKPGERVTKRAALVLGPTDYVRLADSVTGERRTLQGPLRHFLTATESVVSEHDVLPLQKNEYVRVIDHRTGVVRVVRGEATVALGPTEELLGGTQHGIHLDAQTAVLVRDTSNGQLSLITDRQVFIPAADQEVVEVRERIRLEDHETVIIKDREGRYTFRRGSDSERSFFLDPYAELVMLRWSSGLHKDRKDLHVTHFDTRPKYMWYEFDVRTQDNVELVIGITFFWQIVDVEAMLRMTDDTTGDICSHARSAIIQAVSQVTLETFLAEFNAIVGGAVLGDGETPFYDERGVVIHAVEVRSVTCKDPDTQRILQEIIQETTDRLNRLQKQESENEVALRRLQGQIDEETARGQLLAIRREHDRTQAQIDGEAEAERVLRFLDGLPSDLPMGERVAIFNTLRKQQALQALSEGSATLYFTPADVNLSIETT